MTKELIAILALLIACVVISCFSFWISTHILDTVQHNELITVYTCEDILYLNGNRLTSESGIYDLKFENRTMAVDLIENITASHANNCSPYNK